MSKTPCAIEIFLPEKWEGGWGTSHPLAAAQRRVFIVMQISSRNLGHIQVHPVLVAGTETSTSSLLLTSLSALLSHSHDRRGLFCHKAPASLLERCRSMEHIGDLSGPGCHHAPLPPRPGSSVGCTRHTRACSDAVRFSESGFFQSESLTQTLQG